MRTVQCLCCVISQTHQIALSRSTFVRKTLESAGAVTGWITLVPVIQLLGKEEASVCQDGSSQHGCKCPQWSGERPNHS